MRLRGRTSQPSGLSPPRRRHAVVGEGGGVVPADCVEHILEIVPGSAEAELPDGGTLGAIIGSAAIHRYGRRTDDHRLGVVSRIAAARRLRRESTAIGDAAFTAAAQAEGQGVDILSDPAWETLAAARDAVLAAVEAVRHVAFPFLADRETWRYEAHEEHKVAEVDQVDTPWGRFAVGGAGPKYAPSWVAARDALSAPVRPRLT